MSTFARVSILLILIIGALLITQRDHFVYPLPVYYESKQYAFTIRLPEGYAVNESYSYDQLGPDRRINGVKFNVPASETRGTNLSTDSYISVEQLPNEKQCTADKFLDRAELSLLSEGKWRYSVGTMLGAGAGNRYQETVYAILDAHTCMAVRYYLHSTVVENYPEGVVRSFDEKRIVSEFDAIRRSLTLEL